jgi:uncharacterized delta-60 repeat protein
MAAPVIQRSSARVAGAAVTALLLMAAPVLAADTRLDPGFGHEGFISTASAPGAAADYQNGLAVQADGRILVGGASDMGADAGNFQWRISRYLSNGSLDASFGSGGTVLTSMSMAGGDDEALWALAVQPDGKIVGVGQARTDAGGFDSLIARFTTNGTLDATFGQAGRVVIPVAPGAAFDTVQAVAIDGKRRIGAAGLADMPAEAGGRNFAAVRLLKNGSLDRTFDGDGIVTTAIGPGTSREGVNEMAIDASGRIVVGGVSNMGPGLGRQNFALARYNSNGSLDASFAGDGIVTTAVASADGSDGIVSVAIDAGGRIVAGGWAFSGTGKGFFDLALARFNPDGSLDASFGGGGTVIAPAGPGDSDDDLESLVILPNGKIVVGGQAAAHEAFIDGDFMVARFDADGTPDATFGPGGVQLTPLAPRGGDDEIFDIARQADGNVVAAGECEQPDTGRDVCVARYLTAN